MPTDADAETDTDVAPDGVVENGVVDAVVVAVVDDDEADAEASSDEVADDDTEISTGASKGGRRGGGGGGGGVPPRLVVPNFHFLVYPKADDDDNEEGKLDKTPVLSFKDADNEEDVGIFGVDLALPMPVFVFVFDDDSPTLVLDERRALALVPSAPLLVLDFNLTVFEPTADPAPIKKGTFVLAFPPCKTELGKRGDGITNEAGVDVDGDGDDVDVDIVGGGGERGRMVPKMILPPPLFVKLVLGPILLWLSFPSVDGAAGARTIVGGGCDCGCRCGLAGVGTSGVFHADLGAPETCG